MARRRATTTSATAPVDQDAATISRPSALDYQPMHAAARDLQVRGREAAQAGRSRARIPGFNDVADAESGHRDDRGHGQLHHQRRRRSSRRPTARIQNELAGCTTLTGICTAAVPMGQPSNKNNVGLGDLPCIFPDGLGMDPRYYEYKALDDDEAAVLAERRRSCCRRRSPGATASATRRRTCSYPGWLNINRDPRRLAQPDEGLGPAHARRAGFYNHHSFKAQNRGTAADSAARGDELRATTPATRSTRRSATPTRRSGIFRLVHADVPVHGGQLRLQQPEALHPGQLEGEQQADARLRRAVRAPAAAVRRAAARRRTSCPRRGIRRRRRRCTWPGCANGVYPCSGTNRAGDEPGDQAVPRARLGAVDRQLVPGTGNLTNGIFLSGQGIAETTYTWPALALAPRFGCGLRRQRPAAVHLRGATGLFYDRPDGNSIYGLVANPPNSSAVTDQLRAAAEPDVEHHRAAGADGVRVRRQAAVVDRSGARACRWRCRGRRRWTSSYVGQYGYNLGQTVDINQVDIGVGVPAAEPGSDAELDRAGSERARDGPDARRSAATARSTQFWGRGWNTYHSIQTSYNRRFTDGLSFGVNWTLGLSNTTNAGARLQHAADGQLAYRADQEEADELLGRGQLQRHTIKGTFVWDLPDLDRGANAARHVLAAVANDWQLSGDLQRAVGRPVQPRLQLSERRRQREHHGLAQLRRTRDPQRAISGSGCSSNQYAQFNTAAVAGPAVGSVGLESGQNYLTGCFENFMDLRDRAELPPRRQPPGPAPPRDVQRVQHGRLLEPEHDGQHPEPDRSRP